MKAMKHIIFLGLLMVAHGMWAQGVRSCPMRIVPGDPRNNGQEEKMMQADRQRRMAEAQNATMGIPGICTRKTPPRVLVIMVNFKDYTFSTSREHADSLFNATTPLTTQVTADGGYYEHGSVGEYFKDQSLGQYRPKFDVVGPVNLSRSYGYYGQGKGISLHADDMVKEACDSVAKIKLADFSQYDADGDNYIDLVFILFAGFGENDGTYIAKNGFSVNVENLVWPHYSTTSGKTYNGKKLRAYECSNELDGYFSKANPKLLVPAGSGILVHEFSHGLGLPDVYSGETQYMGTWDLMDYGCYNGDTYIPSSYTGWQRWFMNWSKPQWMNETKNVTLRPISESGDFGVITNDGQVCDSMNTTTYWIVENHQHTGWDEYAAGEGLILYQLKYHSGWSGNGVNSESNKSYVLVPADGILRNQGYVGKQEDCYPYGALDSITTIAPNYPITAIRQESNGNITFKVHAPDTPTGLGEGGEKAKGLNGEKVLMNGALYIRRGNYLYSPMGQIVK